MRKIRFELTGILGNQEFEKDSDIKVEAERLFEGLVSKVENTSECKVVNDAFIIDIIESPVIYDEDMIEKDLTYSFILETNVYSALTRDEILDLIHEIATNMENKLLLAVVDPWKGYEYEIIQDSLLFDEIEFVNTISENILNTEIEKISLEVVGFDYTKEAIRMEDAISSAYKKLNNDEIVEYTRRMLREIEKDSDMKYYELSFYYNNPTEKSLELYGEGGLTWYYKSDSCFYDDNEILNECLKHFSDASQYSNLLEAKDYFDKADEITREEFYSELY